jgi:enhancing lycopene biosynthesis protein 2
MTKKIAVILAGCGRLDGSEIHESTLSLLYLAQNGAQAQCFAPDEPQVAVWDNLTGKIAPAETRNQMTEAARIARGKIRPISELQPEDFDGLVVPGGSGGFKNLSVGPGNVHPQLRRVVEEFYNAGKPMAFICIAPVLAARILGVQGVELTIGNDPETATEINNLGAHHIPARVTECIADETLKVVSTPAYMLGPGIADIAIGIEHCIKKLLSWT